VVYTFVQFAILCNVQICLIYTFELYTLCIITLAHLTIYTKEAICNFSQFKIFA